ncbi:MAG: flavin reductase family protein [Bacteriovoracaceae bacterium]|jgi:flavin reductase (DIM6/NTAB) family NADH-FMN oxidoreductase RutF|nr:flavin reductase family protein [Bacteriovoracaceae bacterium]
MSDRSEVAKAVGHIPSGLFIVCAKDPESSRIDGFLASWVQQISFDPLLVGLCLKPGRPAYDLITKGTVFSINVVGDHDASYLKHFWKGYDPNTDPFSEIEHISIDNGAVVISRAKSTMICKIKESHSPGDHQLVVAEVIHSIVGDEKALPKVHIRKSGLDY